MSVDLAVFDLEAAPTDEKAFWRWYGAQTQWSEDHSYDDPAVTTPALAAWFHEMRQAYPAINGPFATDRDEGADLTDYTIGRHLIFASFQASAPGRYDKLAERTAAKLGLGFVDDDRTKPPRTPSTEPDPEDAGALETIGRALGRAIGGMRRLLRGKKP